MEPRDRQPVRLAVGLMSGTSADGIDAVLIRAAGIGHDLEVEVVGHRHEPFPAEVRAAVRAAADPRTGTVDRLCRLNFELGRRFADAASAVLAEAGVPAGQVAVIGSHGQTVWHVPAGSDTPGSTLQIGEPSLIAAATGITTVADFRPADIAVGGQGAPLVPFADYVLYRRGDRNRTVQNIGGIGNLTWLPAGGGPEAVLAFDTGPGNGLIDAAVRRIGGGPDGCGFDRGGAIASSGRVRPDWLERWLSHPYFARRPPKSTGLETFGDGWLDRQSAEIPDLWDRPADLIATLTELTAATIADAHRRILPAAADEVLVCGGGALNPVLMAALRRRMDPAAVRTVAEFGIDVSAKEAVCFALLALATLDGLPGNLPAATGASRPAVLGKICPGRRKAEG